MECHRLSIGLTLPPLHQRFYRQCLFPAKYIPFIHVTAQKSPSKNIVTVQQNRSTCPPTPQGIQGRHVNHDKNDVYRQTFGFTARVAHSRMTVTLLDRSKNKPFLIPSTLPPKTWVPLQRSTRHCGSTVCQENAYRQKKWCGMPLELCRRLFITAWTKSRQTNGIYFSPLDAYRRYAFEDTIITAGNSYRCAPIPIPFWGQKSPSYYIRLPLRFLAVIKRATRAAN